MSLTVTLILLSFCAVMGLVCAWRGARPTNIHKGPRMMPWRFLMLVCAAVGMLLLIHLLALVGGGPGPASYV